MVTETVICSICRTEDVFEMEGDVEVIGEYVHERASELRREHFSCGMSVLPGLPVVEREWTKVVHRLEG